MRVISCISMFLLIAPLAVAADAPNPLRGLNSSEVTELRTGTGMGLARAAELHSYPGPRHVLDAVHDGHLHATPEQVAAVQRIFDAMQADARRIGGDILAEEQALERAFDAATITETTLPAQVERIAMLRGQLRTTHLRAHLATRAVLSAAQVARYNEVRGYTVGTPGHPAPHKH
jgi:hypothetical protein